MMGRANVTSVAIIQREGEMTDANKNHQDEELTPPGQPWKVYIGIGLIGLAAFGVITFTVCMMDAAISRPPITSNARTAPGPFI